MTLDEQPADREAPTSGTSDPHTAPVLNVQTDQGVAVLTLNRPKARNSLSLELMARLNSALDTCAGDKAVHAIIINGAGPVFCAGHDLKEMTAARAQDDRGQAFFERTMGACAQLMQTVLHCPKPVIAAVEGVATAAGCQLVASCDLAIAGRSARFATPGVNIGLFCSTPMVALSRNIPRKRAMEMLLLGELIGAAEAEQWGLLNRVVDDGAALSTAQAFAQTIASKSPVTVAYGKSAFYRQLEMELGAAYDMTARIMVENMLARDAEEGIDAFIAKRPPVWGLPDRPGSGDA